MNIDSDGISLNTDLLILLLIFLFAIDFLDLSGKLIALVIVAFLYLRLTELRFDTSAGVLALFSVFYFGSVAYYEGMTVDVIIKYAIAPWGAYMVGYNLRFYNRSITVVDFATVVAFGFFMHGMLNLYAGIQVFGASLNNNFRLAYDFWQSRTISVTTASLYYTPFTLMSIGAIFFSGRKIFRVMAPVFVGMALYASLIYQNRTLILACGLVVGLNVFLVMIDKDMDPGKKQLIYGALAVMFMAAVIAFIANVGGVRDTIMGSSLFNRMSGDKQDRTTIWKSFIFGDAWKYPFGGTKAVLYENKPFVHNMWLDTFRRAGFFPFLFLVIFTIMSAFNIRTFLHSGKLFGEDCYILISLMGGMMLSFMVEPVIEANPYVFYLPLFVMGAVNGCNKDARYILDSI